MKRIEIGLLVVEDVVASRVRGVIHPNSNRGQNKEYERYDKLLT